MLFELPVAECRLPLPSRLLAVLGPGGCRLGLTLLILRTQRIPAPQAPWMLREALLCSVSGRCGPASLAGQAGSPRGSSSAAQWHLSARSPAPASAPWTTELGIDPESEGPALTYQTETPIS